MSRNKTGTGADGTANAFAKAGEATLAAHHSPMAARSQDHLHGDKSIARAGAPKRLADTSINSGMTDRQRAGVSIGGMGNATPLADGGNAPLAHAYGTGIPKVRAAAPIKEGMRSRQGPLAKSLTDATPFDICGKMLLDEAGK